MVTRPYSWISLLSGHYYKEIAVHIYSHIDGTLIVVRIPGVTGNPVAVGDIVVALVIRSATSAACCPRSIQRQIDGCPSEPRGYRMRLPVLKAWRRMEYEPVIRAPKRVG